MNKRIRKKKAKQRDFAAIVTMNEQLPLIAKYLGKMVESLHSITSDMGQWLAKKYSENAEHERIENQNGGDNT